MAERLGVHYVAEPRPRRYDPNKHLSRRHLPGKHNQKDHGHGHGGRGDYARGGYEPGNWQKDTAARKELAVKFERLFKTTSTPDQVAEAERIDGPDWARKRGEEIAAKNLPGIRYVNGPHVVTIKSKNLTDAQHQQLLADVDDLQTRFPLGRHTSLDLTVDPSFEFRTGVVGDTVTGTGVIRLNDSTFLRDREGAKFQGGMPAAEQVRTTKYVLTHEWGHAIDTDRASAKDSTTHKWAVETGDMSQYGTNSPVEGFAEAFAEHALTDGATENYAAKTYAQEYGWDKL